MSERTRRPTLAEKVAFLSDPAAYPAEVQRVGVVETHMSWVFLVGDRVYKLKKPVVRERFDFRSLDARYKNCVEEVRLNRRLGGNTYIGVERLSVSPDGRLALDKNGVPVDWLVVMYRLPEASMLEHQIKTGTVDYRRVADVATLLASFYQSAAPVPMTAEQYIRRLRDEIADNEQQLLDYGVSPAQIKRAVEQQLTMLDSKSALLGERAAAGRLVEAHGDLRPEHVSLVRPPVVIDCLEFSRDLRIMDPADELAFLAMECEQLGDWRVGEILFQVYESLTGDVPDVSLLAFYKAYRACQRAKLAIWHLDDDREERRGSWRQKAEDYLSCADDYGERF